MQADVGLESVIADAQGPRGPRMRAAARGPLARRAAAPQVAVISLRVTPATAKSAEAPPESAAHSNRRSRWKS